MKYNNYNWYVFDAKDKILGRLATKIVYYLRGKHKINYASNLNCSDYCIVLNAAKIKLTGKKKDNKIYYKYTGYPGGIKSIKLKELLIKYPERIIKYAIKGMMPKNSLSKKILNKLKIYSGEKHLHIAQKLYFLNIN